MTTFSAKRSRIWAASFVTVFALAMGACSNGDNGSTNGNDSAAGSDGIVTVSHSMGETEVPVNPERIVTLANQWFDTLSALDEEVTLSLVPELQGSDQLPWNDAKAQETVNYDAASADAISQNVELIASAEPDVIFAAGLDDDTYAKLSAIAPTVALVGDGVVNDWRDMLTVSGEIFDKEDRAEQLLDEANGRIDQVREENPGLEGATVAFGQVSPNGLAVVTDLNDPANEFLTDLGLVVPEDIQNAGDGASRAFIAEENIKLLDTDMLLMWAIDIDPSTISGWDDLMSVRNNTLYQLDSTGGTAFGTPSVLSVGWSLDQLAPQIAALDEVRG